MNSESLNKTIQCIRRITFYKINGVSGFDYAQSCCNSEQSLPLESPFKTVIQVIIINPHQQTLLKNSGIYSVLNGTAGNPSLL